MAGLAMSLSANIGAAELKIGYVQVDKILQDAPQTAESGKKLERELVHARLTSTRCKNRFVILNLS